MNTKAVLGAVAGALLGALIWALISYFTGYEIGWVAWGIGALVGWGASLMGGEGKNMGLACGALALAAILLGKFLAVHLTVDSEIDKELEAVLTVEEYDSQVQAAREYTELTTDEEVADYMFQYEYTEANRAANVPQEEIDFFKESIGPVIEAFASDPPTYEIWKEERRQMAREMVAQRMTPVSVITSSLSAIDLLFGLLGVSTAYAVGSGSKGKPSPGPGPDQPQED